LSFRVHRSVEQAAGAFRGGEAAKKELEALEHEHDRIARGVRLARSAALQFEAELAELKGKRAQVQETIWREEFDRLSGELQGLDPELHATAEQLKSIIGKRQSLLNEQAPPGVMGLSYKKPTPRVAVGPWGRHTSTCLRHQQRF
jgi:predicted  nucleic acid-binding Zn-ribbon protein